MKINYKEIICKKLQNKLNNNIITLNLLLHAKFYN